MGRVFKIAIFVAMVFIFLIFVIPSQAWIIVPPFEVQNFTLSPSLLDPSGDSDEFEGDDIWEAKDLARMKIQFDLTESLPISVDIVDAEDNVATNIYQTNLLSSGKIKHFVFNWDGMDQGQNILREGNYICRISALGLFPGTAAEILAEENFEIQYHLN